MKSQEVFIQRGLPPVWRATLCLTMMIRHGNIYTPKKMMKLFRKFGFYKIPPPPLARSEGDPPPI